MPQRPPKAKIPRVPGQPERKPRVSARKRGYSAAWEKARAGFLRKHPRCECPEHKGKPTAPRATVVDHHQPHKGDMTLFWNRNNWVPMAAACHSRKTASNDGGFGNRRPEGGLSEKVDARGSDRVGSTECKPAKLGVGGFF
jgi:5-methylcytosine-specific restriction endonuclease McrA